MMASNREPDNSEFIQNVKRMKICWDNILREENGGYVFQSSSTIKQPYTKWLTLGIGPCTEDGSGSSKDTNGKGKEVAAEKKGESGSTGLHTNWLTLKVGSCIGDGSNMHVYVMDEANDAENTGESSKRGDDAEKTGDGSRREDAKNIREEGWEESILIGDIPEEILNMIFCELPLHTLFQVQMVSTSWQSIISGSTYFHSLWEQTNMQRWLVMELYDRTSGSCNGLAFYDVSKKLKYKKMFTDRRGFSLSQCFLRDGDGGLLIYSCKTNGTLLVINPLTMNHHCLEDAKLNRKCRLSYYMKKYHNDVAVHLKVDSKEKTYEVTVIIGKLIPRKKNFIFLTYRSAEQRWEIREAYLEHRVLLRSAISSYPNIVTQNQRMYWTCKYAADESMCDMNGDDTIRFLYVPSRMPGVKHLTLGIVMYKGRMIMICKGEQLQLPPYTHTLVFYAFDDLDGEWRLTCETIVSPKILSPGVTCVGGDYIWVIQETDDYVSHIICIDLDSAELKIWPEVRPFMFNVRKCLSMPLSFCPC